MRVISWICQSWCRKLVKPWGRISVQPAIKWSYLLLMDGTSLSVHRYSRSYCLGIEIRTSYPKMRIATAGLAVILATHIGSKTLTHFKTNHLQINSSLIEKYAQIVRKFSFFDVNISILRVLFKVTFRNAKTLTRILYFGIRILLESLPGFPL